MKTHKIYVKIILSMLLLAIVATAYGEETKNENKDFSIFPGITWGNDIQRVELYLGRADAKGGVDSVEWISYYDLIESDKGYISFYFIRDKLTRIIFYLKSDAKDFNYILADSLKYEFGEYSISNSGEILWSLDDGTDVEIKSEMGYTKLTFKYVFDDL
ncbi:MAG: hypothetical protein PUD22_02725 [Erysipelotrichaceae bacterium]|nr:hypothetical protein [Erysipelotrichaceae bacterium]